MEKEHSAGIVLFHKQDKEFLLLRYRQGHWGFPRGKIEEGESTKKAAVRELEEETGISDVHFIPFSKKIQWYYRKQGDLIRKDAIYFLASTGTKDVSLSSEHLEFCWCPYEDALERVQFANARQVLEEAYQKI